MELKSIRPLCIAAVLVLAFAAISEWLSSDSGRLDRLNLATFGPAAPLKGLTDGLNLMSPATSSLHQPLPDAFPHSDETLPISQRLPSQSFAEAFSSCLPSVDTGFLRPNVMYQDDLDVLLKAPLLQDAIVEHELGSDFNVQSLVVRLNTGLLSCFTKDQLLECDCLTPRSAPATGGSDSNDR